MFSFFCLFVMPILRYNMRWTPHYPDCNTPTSWCEAAVATGDKTIRPLTHLSIAPASNSDHRLVGRHLMHPHRRQLSGSPPHHQWAL